jgi:solute:Na+ symporter, SSS family
MTRIDWILTFVPVVAALLFAAYTRRFVRSVADFIAGGRCAGRYLIANAYGESASGVANTLSKFEPILISGFTLTFWSAMSAPILLLVAVTGFVVYRYRETRALTLAQFFEMRYSRRFRLFMGMLAFVAGILNYGIFPAVNSKFFVYFLDLPQHVNIAGFTVPTFALIMAAYLSCVLMMLMVGGQIALMITDCATGLLSHAILLVVVVTVFLAVGWHDVVHTLGDQPPGRSLLDPMDAWKISDFNVGYVVMTLLTSIYGTMALQNTHGFNSAARSPHESRMAGILGNWRLNMRIVLLLFVGGAAIAFLRHPSASPALTSLAQISDAQVRKQMAIPVALRYLLPAGVKGLFCATMVLGMLAGDCSHIHSWSSIFVQDVILPLRKTPMTTRQHLGALRIAVLGVAIFAFIFSLTFRQTQYIMLWWAVTNGVFISGAGAAIIGGLYTRRGTTSAAWSAVITGAILSLTGIALQHQWPQTFRLNGTVVAFIAAITSSLVYIIVSFLSRRRDFDLSAMFQRRAAVELAEKAPALKRSLPARIMGFNESFTRGDKTIAAVLLGYSFLAAGVNVVVVLMNLFHHWTIEWWSTYWLIFALILPMVLGAATLSWFTLGGLRDTRDFFRALRTIKRDARDDGRVETSFDTQPGGVPVLAQPTKSP